MSTKNITESQLTKSVCDFLDLALPSNAVYVHIPNELGHGRRPHGFKPGFPDILILHKGQAWAIELKRPDYRDAKGKLRKSSLRPEQGRCIEALAAAGVPCTVCKSVDQVGVTLRVWGIMRGENE